MSAGIEQMAIDLEAAAARHAENAVTGIREVVVKMERAVQQLSSPAHSVVVRTSVARTKSGASLKVQVRGTDGIGTVFGGIPAVAAQAKRRIADIAEGAGLA